MLILLEASKIIAREGDFIRLIQPAFIPESDPVEKIDIPGSDVDIPVPPMPAIKLSPPPAQIVMYDCPGLSVII